MLVKDTNKQTKTNKNTHAQTHKDRYNQGTVHSGYKPTLYRNVGRSIKLTHNHKTTAGQTNVLIIGQIINLSYCDVVKRIFLK